jgi:putative toxin-antitoxin system antitoxin component (TIGR02293 family)
MATEGTMPQIFEYPAGGSAELIRTVEEGLPLNCLDMLREWGLTFTEVGELVIPPRTLKHRKAKGERLTTEETERFLRVVRVLQLAERVFGDRRKALGWLRTRDEQMDNRVTIELLGTEAGARRVEGQIWAIDEGMFT